MNVVNILVGIVIVIILYYVLTYLFRNKGETTLVKVHDARVAQVINAGSLPSGSSVNYAYSIWLYINDWNYRFGETKIVFGRVDQNNDPAPSVTLAPSTNNLNISLATYPTNASGTTASTNPAPSLHTCSVEDIPLQRWVNVLLSLNNRALDIYIDGKLVKTCVLPGVPKLNPSSNVHITPDGGFSGFISNFRYFSDALNPSEAYNVYKQGYDNGSAITGLFNKYRIKLAFMEDNKEVNSLEI